MTCSSIKLESCSCDIVSLLKTGLFEKTNLSHHLRLIGSDVHLRVSCSFGNSWYLEHFGEEGLRWEHYIDFELVFENSSEEIKEKLIYHLDLYL